jgi:hypothetical protein
LNLGHLDFDIVSNFELRISDFAGLGIFTLVENALQISPFLTNKANFPDAQMNVNKVLTKDYENEPLFKRGKNKPNSNPNKANFKRNLAKMGHHEAAKCVDTAPKFTLNLTKNSNSVQNNDKAKK